MLLEFCAENFTKIPEAIELGVKRIELCDNLAVGGTTPSYAVMEHSIEYAQKANVDTAVMIRPRGGSFVYSEEEITMMKKDLIVAKEFSAEGVVFGCLTEDGRIHRDQVRELLALTQGVETIFHMAFDHIKKEYQKEELSWLIEQGVTRILTHGGLGGTVEDNSEWLKELMDYAEGRMEFVVGGGVTYENYESLAEDLPTNQFHGTKIVNFID